MYKISLASLCFFLTSSFVVAQYTIADYYNEKEWFDAADSALAAQNYAMADSIFQRFEKPRSPFANLQLARIAFHLGKPYEPFMKEAFNKSTAAHWNYFGYYDMEGFVLEHQHMVDSLYSLKAPWKDHWEGIDTSALRSTLIKMHIDDQRVRTGEPTDLDMQGAVDIRNLEILDSVIALYGWPSSTELNLYKNGPDIVLAHQDTATMGKADYDRYYKLTRAMCRAKRESWQTPLSILSQRFRRYASSKRRAGFEPFDTLRVVIDNYGNPNLDAQPYLRAMSKTVGQSHTKLTITTPTDELGAVIKKTILRFERLAPPDFPAEMIEMLKAQGFQTPAKINDERLIIKTDPTLPANMVIYGFDLTYP